MFKFDNLIVYATCVLGAGEYRFLIEDEYPYIIMDELTPDIEEEQEAQKRRSRNEKSYLAMMPKYNGRKK